MKTGKANSEKSSDPSSLAILSQNEYNKTSAKVPVLDRIRSYVVGKPREPRILTNFGWVDPKIVEKGEEGERGF